MLLHCRCGEPIQVEQVPYGAYTIPVFYSFDPLNQGFEIERCTQCSAPLSLSTLLGGHRVFIHTQPPAWDGTSDEASPA